MKIITIGFAPIIAITAFVVASCKTQNVPPPPLDAAAVPPAGYPQPGGAEIPSPPEQGGRFGYNGGTTPPPAPPAPPQPTPRDVREMEPSTTVKKEEVPVPPAPSKPSTSNMSFANPVPGNPLVVTLPGANASLGQISVEKYDSSGNATGEALSRGTQVQIPDPNNPGKKIYFKVP